MKKIVFASTNAGKIAEIKALMPDGIELISQTESGFDGEVEETGKTFEENAELKARAVFDACGLPCFADDSGLEVKALKGKPGVKSARYAGEPSDTARNNALLLDNMKGIKDRRASFTTVICLVTVNRTLYFTGSISGVIAETPSGINGFGYDPLFIPDGHTKTFAEMDSEEKNAISHRKQALKKMLPFLQFI